MARRGAWTAAAVVLGLASLPREATAFYGGNVVVTALRGVNLPNLESYGLFTGEIDAYLASRHATPQSRPLKSRGTRVRHEEGGGDAGGSEAHNGGGMRRARRWWCVAREPPKSAL